MTKPLVKFCGNKTLQDYQISSKSQVDYLGFVFAKSKRQVGIEEVALWVKTETFNQKKLVGVFVNQTIEEIVLTVDRISLSVIQLHGDETPTFIKQLRERTNAHIWKVIHHDDNGLQRMNCYQGLVDGYVIDNKVGSQYGGTGRVFDWTYLPRYLEQAQAEQVPCFVAGGIREENISNLLNYQPGGIDLSSGIEHEFKKDYKMINVIERKVRDHATSTNT
ncbi:phosphoribosylanthranilate isomerase [Sutcliffiella halmapala]|uniref:phosphoribosylanthranilate isomerase n=1 Tax=Sutcliffiella halmapala TaxID=79882 RepID=UPI000995DA40|nr:phosphoribosylanthranilate isomerase [Sutcliffiella halmapala]